MEIYDDVLKKCHLRIKYNSSLERTYCFYQIPEFIIGVPLYDTNEMKTYVMNSLKNNGLDMVNITFKGYGSSQTIYNDHRDRRIEFRIIEDE